MAVLRGGLLVDAATQGGMQGGTSWLLDAKTRWPALPEGYRRRPLVEALCRTAEDRQLRRVLMNGVALSMATERGLGRVDNAVADLADFLRIAATSDYLRPLARQREETLNVLPALLATEREADVHAAAELLEELDEPAEEETIFSAREVAIVRRVEQGRDNTEIAQALGVSELHVEAHLEAIRQETGAIDRDDIADVARRLSPPPVIGRRPWRGRRTRSRP